MHESFNVREYRLLEKLIIPSSIICTGPTDNAIVDANPTTLLLHAKVNEGFLRLSGKRESGHTYQLQVSNDLSIWRTAGPIIEGTSQEVWMDYLNPTGADVFFRLARTHPSGKSDEDP